jgi:hypothetical protein
MIFVNFYECPCGTAWHDQWDCACNDRCPSCDTEVEPSRSDAFDAVPAGSEPQREQVLG